VALALDRSDGRIVWQKVLREAEPVEQGHYTASQASNSPVTDGERLYAFFGSHGLYCLDWEGNVVWERDFGAYVSLHGHGEGASPVLHGDRLVVNWDHEGQSFVAALDKKTGEDLWRVERKEVTSWSSPIVVDRGGRQQVIVSGTSRVRGYDLATGEILWECAGLSANVVASPVAGDGIVYAGSSYDVRALLAIRLDGAAGEISRSENVLWRRSNRTPYVPSPLLYGESLYFLDHYRGVMTRIHGPSGDDRPGPFRLAGLREIYSSPVGAADRVYVTDRDGATLVFRHGDDPTILAINQLDDTFSSSAAIAGDEIFLRGEARLYCIAEGP
jgi:outer membrane protein assembly factor BamB